MASYSIGAGLEFRVWNSRLVFEKGEKQREDENAIVCSVK